MYLLFFHATAFILSFRVIDKSMKNFKAFFRWLYVGKNKKVFVTYHKCAKVLLGDAEIEGMH